MCFSQYFEDTMEAMTRPIRIKVRDYKIKYSMLNDGCE